MVLNEAICFSTPDDLANRLLEPIYRLNASWVEKVGLHVYDTAKRDHAEGEEAALRLRTFAVITAGDNRYSLECIGEKFARGESYPEILDYAERTYSNIESVRQWLKDDPGAKEELWEAAVNNIDWF